MFAAESPAEVPKAFGSMRIAGGSVVESAHEALSFQREPAGLGDSKISKSSARPGSERKS